MPVGAQAKSEVTEKQRRVEADAVAAAQREAAAAAQAQAAQDAGKEENSEDNTKPVPFEKPVCCLNCVRLLVCISLTTSVAQ